MLNTFQNNQFQILLSDSTVTLTSGLARISNSLIPFDGTTMVTNDMANISAGYYQNVLLFLERPDASSSGVDMTSAVSEMTTSIGSLRSPVMPSSDGYPVGLITMYSSDGTANQIVSYSSI
jgi:hypothetical protein